MAETKKKKKKKEEPENDVVLTPPKKVEVTPLERDEMVSVVRDHFFETLQGESGYKDLEDSVKREIQVLFNKMKDMRFKNLYDFENIFKILLESKSPDLSNYIQIAMKKAKDKVSHENKGVLVIYSGGTVGSAPKDMNDPDSPQVVKPWHDLKYAIPGLDRIGYKVDAISFEEPLDSCNVGPAHWLKMANIISDHYKEYEGFVILHGTDTMIYTASALALMLLDLAKPVIITGSQIEGVTKLRNDAHQNFITALNIANPSASNIPLTPEVCIYFGGKLVRGCRAKKVDASGYAGFDSPNFPLLGTAGDQIDIDTLRLRPVPDIDQVDLLSKLETNVITIDVFPGIQYSQVVQKLLSDENLKGVVLRSYGTGNIPTDKAFLQPFEKITDRVVVVNVTQCQAGTVEMGLYETSQVLLDRGIIGGFDITAEAALCKLMILLGEYGDNIDTVKELMQRSLAGEQHHSVISTHFVESGKVDPGNLRYDLKALEIKSVDEDGDELIDSAILRFHNARLAPGEGHDYLRLKIFVDLREDAPDEDSPKFAGSYAKLQVPSSLLVDADEVGESLAFDITSAKELLMPKHTTRRVIKAQKTSFTILMDDSQEGSFEWDKVELNLFTTE